MLALFLWFVLSFRVFKVGCIGSVRREGEVEDHHPLSVSYSSDFVGLRAILR